MTSSPPPGPASPSRPSSCLAAGVAFDLLVGELQGKVEQAVEGTLAFTAAGVLTWMIFWMRRHARGISGELRGRIDGALSGVGPGADLVAFVAVAREGFETALFLIGAKSDGATGLQVVIGGLAGLAVSAAIGLAISRGGAKIDIGRFFWWTGLLLLVFAAGLFGKGVHEYRELLGIEWAVLVTPAWTISSGPARRGAPGPRLPRRPARLEPRPRARPGPRLRHLPGRDADPVPPGRQAPSACPSP